MDIIIKIIETISIGYTLYYSKYITFFKLQYLLTYKQQAIKQAYCLK